MVKTVKTVFTVNHQSVFSVLTQGMFVKTVSTVVKTVAVITWQF